MKSYKEFSEEYSQLDERRNPFKRRPRIRKPRGGDVPDAPSGKKKTPIKDFAGAIAGGLGWGTAAQIGSNLVGKAKEIAGKALNTDEGDQKVRDSKSLKAVEKHT